LPDGFLPQQDFYQNESPHIQVDSDVVALPARNFRLTQQLWGLSEEPWKTLEKRRISLLAPSLPEIAANGGIIQNFLGQA